MRIISGSARGRRLFSPASYRVRPTADRVKEALFNILAGLVDFSGCRALDIFAGTGNLGIESLSRGAGVVVFVDSHRESAALVRKNLSLVGLESRGRIIEREVLTALGMLEKEGERFDLVFLDPPYAQGLAEKTLRHLADSPLLHAGSVVVAEISSREEVPGTFGPLVQFDRRIYGDTALVFFSLGE
ncbi:16S rRNA (guanine(966)-N(2))-methyltransferase RsmD [Geobacter sp. AOG1]|uniref:16S rRNA (guanine(966)-N(2))-methyltransferase RsmD n=1 Tax=Geobacter sp. AOG1 TaxID=1566346 RepID=UPI001CC74BF1|nr:16S rRNA (guanine(966)-N(2))-methyltransferase RsmD [Geobacter sp. AOG1]GFE58226.1 methyltransferase [Geobacter sp. AOG1]